MTERDIEMLCFIAVFGKSYTSVLAKCFFHGVKNAEQVAKNRIAILVNKYKVLAYKNTGLSSPRNYLVLTDAGREIAQDKGYDTIRTPHFSITTIEHNMMEQIAFFYLSKVRETVRTTVKTHSKDNAHTPDLLFFTEAGKKVYVELELHKKTTKVYGDIFTRCMQDQADMVLYIAQNDIEMIRLAKIMPTWDKLRFTTLEALANSISIDGKISSKKQSEAING